jgi:putative hydrolase
MSYTMKEDFKMSDYTIDLHTHTIASGHGSTDTIIDLAKSAKSRGITTLGISDHGPCIAGSAKPSYFRGLSFAPKEHFGVHMLYGVEVDILDNKGRLDLNDEILARLDYVIASMHSLSRASGTLNENTTAYIHAIQNPYVKFLGHPDDTEFPVDYRAVILAARNNGVALEINNASLSPDGYRGDTQKNARTILELCMHFKNPIILGSDSHGKEHVGDFTYAKKLIDEVGFPNELILNTSEEKLRSFLK